MRFDDTMTYMGRKFSQMTIAEARSAKKDFQEKIIPPEDWEIIL